MVFSIRLTEDERALAESYAKIHSYSLAEAFKKALFEKIEEEYDIAVYHAAYKEDEESGKQSRPIEELWKELEIRMMMSKRLRDFRERSKSWMEIQEE
ncbi:MAG: DUF6290 family protein [Clostridiales bacterium]|nr:DUF6290 family protein [Clostridiales bacterium]